MPEFIDGVTSSRHCRWVEVGRAPWLSSSHIESSALQEPGQAQIARQLSLESLGSVPIAAGGGFGRAVVGQRRREGVRVCVQKRAEGCGCGKPG